MSTVRYDSPEQGSHNKQMSRYCTVCQLYVMTPRNKAAIINKCLGTVLYVNCTLWLPRHKAAIINKLIGTVLYVMTTRHKAAIINKRIGTVLYVNYTLWLPGKSYCNKLKAADDIMSIDGKLIYHEYITMNKEVHVASTLRRVSCVWWFMCTAVQWIPWPCSSLAVDWYLLHV